MDCTFESRGHRASVIALLRRGYIVCGLSIVSVLPLTWPAQAIELQFTPPLPEAPPLRRLPTDPARLAGAPTALDIEYAAIKDDAQTALGLAMRTLEASREAYGQLDARTIIPLTNQGSARLRAGQPQQAIKDFGVALDLAATAPSPRDPRLADIHYGIGAAQHALGRLKLAVESFENGLQAHRVNHGLYSPEQIDFLRALAVSNRAMGKIEDASRWQQKRVQVAEQVHGGDLPTLAWHYVSAGRWFRDVQDFDQAVKLHGRAVDAIHRKQGAEASLLVGPLLDLAISGVFWEPSEDSPRIPFQHQPNVALRRAYRIALARTDGTVDERARSLERVGDLHWLFGLRREALRAYARSAEITKGGTDRIDFSLPAFLVFRPPPIPVALSKSPGHLLAEFTVDNRGRAKDVAIVEGLPPKFSEALGESLTRAIETSRLRPSLDKGRPTTTREVRYRVVVPPASNQRAQAQTTQQSSLRLRSVVRSPAS
ncbi:MAG: tetratricopeptide repeat protein [Panacagrimonas sp.]